MEIVAINLSKALKVKNRLAGRLSKVKSTILTYNSVIEGRKGEVDVTALDKERADITEALISLKVAIFQANNGIHREISELGEKKSEVSFLGGLYTRHGTEPAMGIHNNPVTYFATIQKKDVDERTKKLEAEIDSLQDKIDAYNAVPERLKIEKRILELAS